MTLNRKKDQVKHLIFKSILLWKYVQGAHISHPSGHDLPTTSRKSNSRNQVFYYVSNRYHNALYAPRNVGRNVKECWKLTILVCCSSAHNVLVLGVLKLCTARRVQLLIWRNLPGSDSQVVQPFSDLGSYNKSVGVVHVFQLSFGLGMFWILYAYDACGPSRQTSSILDTCRVEGPWKALDCRFMWLTSSWPVTWESLVIEGTSTRRFRTLRYTDFW